MTEERETLCLSILLVRVNYCQLASCIMGCFYPIGAFQEKLGEIWWIGESNSGWWVDGSKLKGSQVNLISRVPTRTL